MKIAIIDLVLNSGGGYRFTTQLVSALANISPQNHYHLVTGLEFGIQKWQIGLKNVSHHRVITPRTLSQWLPDGRFLNIPGTWKAKKWLRRIFPVDLLNDLALNNIIKESALVYFPWPTDHLPVAEKCLGRKPIVVTIHDLLWQDIDFFGPEHQESENAKIRKWLSICSGTVAITDQLRLELLEFNPPEKNKFSTIHQAVPTLPPPRDPVSRSDLLSRLRIRPPFVFYPAGLWPHKNHTGLAAAIAKLVHSGLKVQLVCTGTATDAAFQPAPSKIISAFPGQVRRDIQALGLKQGEDVIGLGFVDDQTLADLYASASLVVVPSLAEGCSFTLLEAAALGRPVACSKIPAHLEMAGFYHISPTFFDPKDTGSIAASLASLLNQKESRDPLPVNEYLVQRSWSDVASQYLELFRSFDY